MASTDEAAPSRPKRPAPMTRQSSSQSHISQSPSEKGHHRPAQYKVNHRHVAGGRMQRTTSTGKNLGKFAKAAQQPQATEDSGRHHRRSQSGTSISAPSSPRPGFKRNASSGAIMRHNPQAHAHAGLRKNHSSGHLVGKAKGGKSSKDLAQVKGKLGNPSRSRQASPEERPIVHFDVGKDDNDENDEEEGGWTEESASQSPNTTRSNTRSNSVAAEAQRVVDDATESNTRANAGDTSPAPAAEPPQTRTTYTLPERARAPPQTNRAASSHHSRPPDADLITSRLLQRNASHAVVAPQSSSVSATVASTADRGHQLSTSVGSTLVDTPGRDLVSRFMDGDGSAGTPRDGSCMPGRRVSKDEGDLDASKRNKSMPSFGDAEDGENADTPTRPQSVKSGTTTPNLFPSINNRTQNKLLLQRAASAIEPHAPVPAILRTGGPSFHNIGLSYPGEGRLDPRLQQQFNHVAIEYRVVQRYRNPLSDSIIRVQQMPGMLRRLRATKPASTNESSSLGVSTLSSSINENGVETDGARSRRSATSFEQGGEDEEEGRRSLEERPRNEAEELCRRMWDSAEIVGGE
ncbi:hypothetical protein BU25DRAFT_461949 [Macroventuria anomochaeta]|uniref:Uncharacterized protein n=1 Tax=Macroventuria anomochaeta TaxID=301207 RepID=A0ACB6RRM9_9PLEO|nr:uncharacterized protein BU25DRAFT_461949 [Macroventuria anomochaeta]KAF2623574.1 hypothetical protein BU25DRAFT_461949 [Macroventuria anomochaeta]